MESKVRTARCHDAVVTRRWDAGPDAFVFELELEDDPGEIRPGQFAMLSPGDGSGPAIPRPFSVFDRTAARRCTFLVQVIGAGTRALGRIAEGGAATCTLPLGNGFAVADAARPVVMVAGGVGSAPFLLYGRARIAAGAGERTWMLYGARSAERLYEADAFDEAGIRLHCVTEDGTRGARGGVLDELARALDAGELPREARVLACGPEGMLHAFADLARACDLDAEISLETYMGCGYGVCNACPVPTAPDGPWGGWPWAKTCVHGPVFALDAIRF